MTIGILIAVVAVVGLLFPDLDPFEIGQVVGWFIGIGLILTVLYLLGRRGK